MNVISCLKLCSTLREGTVGEVRVAITSLLMLFYFTGEFPPHVRKHE